MVLATMTSVEVKRSNQEMQPAKYPLLEKESEPLSSHRDYQDIQGFASELVKAILRKPNWDRLAELF